MKWIHPLFSDEVYPFCFCKQILKDHFHGFWELHANLFPEELQSSSTSLLIMISPR
ncbi:hypothetical protein FHS15_000465 [Paenibacillus castaneae]|nr:hypothetical protein [Paenibacillus castaneae]